MVDAQTRKLQSEVPGYSVHCTVSKSTGTFHYFDLKDPLDCIRMMMSLYSFRQSWIPIFLS